MYARAGLLAAVACVVDVQLATVVKRHEPVDDSKHVGLIACLPAAYHVRVNADPDRSSQFGCTLSDRGVPTRQDGPTRNVGAVVASTRHPPRPPISRFGGWLSN